MPKNVVHFASRGKPPAQPRRLNPKKLQRARKAKALTQTDLAKEVGLTRQAVSAYEQGAKVPEADKLIEIAKILEQPISYFVAPEREAFGPFSARTYRAFGSATKKRNEQCDVLADWLSEIAAYVDETVNFPTPKIPEIDAPSDGDGYSEDEIEVAAETVRLAWGLGPGPIGNLTKLIESRGVFVGHLPVTSGGVNAFSYWSGIRPFIVTGANNTTAVRRRFDMAHELGHLVLHQGIGSEELEEKEILRRVEFEANRFAGALLMPRASYPNEVFSTRIANFLPLKERWKVAIAAQIYRCSDLGILTDEQVLNLRKQVSAKKWRTREPLDDTLPVEQPQMLRRAMRIAIDGGVVDVPMILNDLNLNTSIISSVLGLCVNDMQIRHKGTELNLTLK